MKETIETYKRAGTDYKEGSLLAPEAAWIERALAPYRKGTTVFEFGSGLGTRSAFIESLGYRVQRSDVAGSFLEHLRGASPEPMLLDLRTDPLPLSNIFYASAVLLHFSKAEIPGILKKIYEATKDGGTFFFSLKEGQGEGMEDGPWGRRFFAYWQEAEIIALLLEVGWQRVDMTHDHSSRQEKMIEIIARKSSA